MFRMNGSKIVRAALILCVLMQVVAMTPHHHHAGDESVCLNYFHLNDGVEHDGCCDSASQAHGHDGCCDDHGHDNDPFTTCNSHNLVITQPERERPETEVQVSVIIHPDNCFCGICGNLTDIAISEAASALTTVEYLTRPDIEPSLIRYISTALSPRAPDFMA